MRKAIAAEASLSATASLADHPPYSNHRHLYPLSPLRQDEVRRKVGANGNIAEGSLRGRCEPVVVPDDVGGSRDACKFFGGI
jgi:hypothetical protein